MSKSESTNRELRKKLTPPFASTGNGGYGRRWKETHRHVGIIFLVNGLPRFGKNVTNSGRIGERENMY